MNRQAIRPWLQPIVLGAAMLAQIATAVALSGALDRERAAMERADRALDYAAGFKSIADEWRRLSLEMAADRCAVDIGLRGSL